MPNSFVDNQISPNKIAFFQPVDDNIIPIITVFYVNTTGQTKTLEVKKNTPVQTIKELVADKEELPPIEQRLIFAGKQLEIGMNIDDYNVQDESTLHLILNGDGGNGEYDAIRHFLNANIVHGNVTGLLTKESILAVEYIRSENATVIEMYDNVLKDISFRREYKDPKLQKLCLKATLTEVFHGGNCQEMAQWTAVKLIESTKKQWVYICSFKGTFTLEDDIDIKDENHPLYDNEAKEVSNKFDHVMVITYPTEVVSIDAMDPITATVVDTWYDHLTCSLASYRANKHPYYNYKYAVETARVLQEGELVLQQKFKAIGKTFAKDKEPAKDGIRKMRKQIRNLHKNVNFDNIGGIKYEFPIHAEVRDERSVENLEQLLINTEKKNQHIKAIDELMRPHFTTIFTSTNPKAYAVLFKSAHQISPRSQRSIRALLMSASDTIFTQFCELATLEVVELFFKKKFSNFENNTNMVDTLDGWLFNNANAEIILKALSFPRFNFYTQSTPKRFKFVLGINDNAVKNRIKPLLNELDAEGMAGMLAGANTIGIANFIDSIQTISREKTILALQTLTQAQSLTYLSNKAKDEYALFYQNGADDPLLQEIFKLLYKAGISHENKAPVSAQAIAYSDKLTTDYWDAYVTYHDTRRQAEQAQNQTE